MAKPKKRRSAFVPRALVRGAVVAGVIPACALAACGSDTSGTTPDTGSDSASGAVYLGPGVAARGFSGMASGAPESSSGTASVANFAYSPDGAVNGSVEPDATDATSDATSQPDGATDGGARTDGAPHQDGASDATTRPDVVPFGVAAVAYPAYEGGRG